VSNTEFPRYSQSIKAKTPRVQVQTQGTSLTEGLPYQHATTLTRNT